MSVLIVIPARFESVRFPGKPLVKLVGADGQSKSLINRTWDAAINVAGVGRVVVATDDERVRRAVQDFGGEAVMTSPDCANGTERCAEAFEKLGSGFDLVVNFQGDAPLTPNWFVEDLVAGLTENPEAAVATPVLRCNGRALNNLLEDRKAGRVGGTTAVFGLSGRALYFSKEVIPFTSNKHLADDRTPVYHHVGVYAYRPEALLSYPAMKVGPLEILEGLEQLRFLEHFQQVLCVEVDARGRDFWELNNPEDVAKLELMMAEMGVR